MMTSNKTIYINGRYLSQQMTGVQRFAGELVGAVNSMLEQADYSGAVVLLVPPNAISIPKYTKLQVKVVGEKTGHRWEQAELPKYCKNGLLVNLGNTAPLLVKDQVSVIHDMAVYTVPETYSLGFRLWYKLMFFVLSKRKTCIATVSEFSRQEIHRFLNIPLDKITVLIEGREHIIRAKADDAVFKKHGISDRPYILAVSSMTTNKNFSVVVKAIELMGITDFDFVIAGGANPNVFASSSKGLPASVKHVGYVSDEELKALYEKAACFVFPSLYEGFGLPPMEAMTCGCPVVGSNRASIPEVCGDAAVYFDPLNPADVKEKILSVMTNPSLRAELKVKGQSQVEKFSWGTSAKQLLNIITIAQQSLKSRN